ncbi:MAG: Ca-activated chloride channel [Blastocatellia bacterium]
MRTRILVPHCLRAILLLALGCLLSARALAWQDPYSHVPPEFFRVGRQLGWDELKPDHTGRRYFNMFSDFNMAKDYMGRAYEDRVVRLVKKEDLARTEDGRAFLAEVERIMADYYVAQSRGDFVEQRNDFTLMLTTEASFQALVSSLKEFYRPDAPPSGGNLESHTPVFEEIREAQTQPDAPPHELEPAAVKPDKQAAIETFLRTVDSKKLAQDLDAGNFDIFKNELFNPKSGDPADTARAWKKVCSKSEFRQYSQTLALMRWKLFLDVWAEVAQENGLPLELIDSGKRNAYASDIDVTVYARPEDRGNAAMADIIAEAESRFQSKYGYKPDALDITIHNGDVFLPDPHNSGQSFEEYSTNLRRVVSDLRAKVTSGGDASYVPGANLDDVQKRGLRDGIGTALIPEVEVVSRAADGTPLETRFKKPTAVEFHVTELDPSGYLINSSLRFGGVRARYDRSHAFGNLAQDLEKVFRNGKDPAAVAKLFNRGMAQGAGAGQVNSFLEIETSNLPDTGMSPEEAARLALELEKPETRRLPAEQLKQLRERGRNKAVAKFRWIVKAFGLSPTSTQPANIQWLYELLNTTTQMEIDKGKGRFDFQGDGRARYLKKYFERLKAADSKRAATPEGINELYDEAYRELCSEIVEAFETAMVKATRDALRALQPQQLKRNAAGLLMQGGKLAGSDAQRVAQEVARKLAETRRVEFALLFDFIERADLETNFETGKRPLYKNFISDQSERLKALRDTILESTPQELRAEIEKLDNIARTQMENYLREVATSGANSEQALAAKEQIVNRLAEAAPDQVTDNELAEHLHRLLLLEANPVDFPTLQGTLDTIAEAFHNSTTGTTIDPKTGKPVSRYAGAGFVEQVWENSTGLMVGSAAVNLARAYVTGGKQAVKEAAISEAFNFLPPAYGIIGVAFKDFSRGHVKEGLVSLAQIGALQGLSALGYPGVGHAMLVYNIATGVPQVAYTYVTNNINDDMVEQAFRSRRAPGKRAQRNPYKDSVDLFKGDTPEFPVFWDSPCMKSEDNGEITPEVVRKAEHLFGPAIWKELIGRGMTPGSGQWSAERSRLVMKYAFDLPYYQRMSKIYDCYHDQVIAQRNRGFDEDNVLKSVFGKEVEGWFASQPDGYKLEFNSVFDIGPNEGRTRRMLLERIRQQVIAEYKRYEYVTFDRINQEADLEKQARERRDRVANPEKRLLATKKLVLDRLQQKIEGLLRAALGQQPPTAQTAIVRVKAPSWYVNMSGILGKGSSSAGQSQDKPSEQRAPNPSPTPGNDDGEMPIAVSVQADRAAFPGHPTNWKHDYKLTLAGSGDSAITRGKPAGFEPNDDERKALDEKDLDGKPLNDIFTVRLNATARAYDESGKVIGEAQPVPVVGYFIAEVPRYRQGINIYIRPRGPDGKLVDPDELKGEVKIESQAKPITYNKFSASTLSTSFGNLGVGSHTVTFTSATPNYGAGTAQFEVKDPYSKAAISNNTKLDPVVTVEIFITYTPPPPVAQPQPPSGQQGQQGQSGGTGQPPGKQGQGGQAGQGGQTGQGGQGGQTGQGGQGGSSGGKTGGQTGQGNPPSSGGGGNQPDPKAVQECQGLLAQAQQMMATGDTAGAQQVLQQLQQKNCGALDPAINQAIGSTEQQIENGINTLVNNLNQNLNAANCEYEAAYRIAEQIRQINPNHPGLSKIDINQLSQSAVAQREARVYLRQGKAAIEAKNLDGAIGALDSALGVSGLPNCMRPPMLALKLELERRKQFIALTEEVEEATRQCDYNRAQQAVGSITRLTPRYDFITNWINTEVPKLAELLKRRQQALQLIREADGLAAQAESAAAAQPADWNQVSQLADSAVKKLEEADRVAPRCMKERDQMDAIRQRLLGLQRNKPAQIQTSIVLLIDTSGSMGQSNKMENAKAAARVSVRNATKTTEMAILNFDGGCSGGSVRIACPFTSDINALLAAIDGLRPGNGTPMYIAVGVATEYAKKSAHGKSALVVLMSDGGDSCRDQQAQAAAAIRSSNIPVNTIGYDVGSDPQAQGDLNNLATMTNGRSYSASTADPKEIVNAFKLAMLPSLFKEFDDAGSGTAVQGFFYAAKTAIQQQDLNGATLQLQQAYRIAPNSAAVNYNLALVHEANDKPLSAIKHAQNYLNLAPNALDRSDIETRITQMQKDVQENPRAQYDPTSCRDIYNWALTEREAAKRAGNPTRLQAMLEIQIASQRGDCANAHRLQDSYKQRFH